MSSPQFFVLIVKNNTMDLINAIINEPLEKIKEIIASIAIPVDSTWLDYELLMTALKHKRNDVAKFLVEKNFRVNKITEKVMKQDTPLHLAVKSEDCELVTLLLSKNADVTAVGDNNDRTPIHVAYFLSRQKSDRYFSFFDYKEPAEIIIDDLLSHLKADMPNINASDCLGFTHLHIASAQGHTKAIKTLAQAGVDINQQIDRSRFEFSKHTSLHLAVENESKKSIYLLLKLGANIHLQNDKTMTALHLGFYKEKHRKKLDHRKLITVVDVLYQALNLKTNDSNVIDKYGLSYFHVAISRNDVEVVTKFLDRKEDVNKQILTNEINFSRFFPLHFAARYGCKEVAKVLIERGAKVNCCNVHKYGSPLHLAVDNGDSDMIDLLLKHGARVKTHRPCDKKTVLHILVEYELRDDRDLEDESIPYMTNYLFSRNTNHDYIKKFIRLDCDVNAQDSNGNTALHLACTQLREGRACVQQLLKYGADINIENKEGQVAFQESIDCQGYRMNNESFMMLYHHVQKLKTLGLQVNPKNDEFCKQVLEEKGGVIEDSDDEDDEEQDLKCFSEHALMQKQQKRLDEIMKLKKVMVDDNETISIHDILLMDPRQVNEYCDCQKFKNIVETKDLCKKYPNYGFMIELQFYKGLKAKKERKSKRHSEKNSDVPSRKRKPRRTI